MLKSLFARFGRTDTTRHLADIDGLRALAVLSVILFHLDMPYITGGYVGVDLFFVISGFLITGILQREMEAGHFSFANFWERRVRRIVPSLLAMLVFALVGSALLLSMPDMKSFGESMGTAVLMAGNIYFFAHNGYFESDADTKPLLHLWSLGVEAQFYLIWPFILLVMLRTLPRNMMYIAAAILGLISVAIAVALQGQNTDAAFYLVPSRLVEFLLGAALVWIPDTRAAETLKKPLPEVIFAAGLALIFICLFTYTKHTPFPSYYALVPCLGAAAILYSARAAKAGVIFSNPLMSYLGRISYELYLFHWTLIVFFKYIAFEALGALDKCIILAITLLLSMFTYHCIGLPLRRASSDTLEHRHNYIIALLVACIALLGVSASIKASGGWPWRIPASARLFASDPGKFHETQFGGYGFKENTLITLGDATTPPQFFMFGDSFASQYAGALNEFLLAHHTSAYLYFLNGCLITPSVTAHLGGQINPVCNDTYARVQQVLANNNLPVVQAQSWSSYKDQLADRAGNSINFVKENNDGYYAFMIQLIDQMHTALGPRRYVFLGISPGISEQKTIARCFQVPTYIPNKCSSTVGAPEATRLNGQEFNLAAQKYADAHPEIAFLNPRSALCHDGMCYAISATKIFYSDYAHFTKDGAREVIDHNGDLLLSLHPAPVAPAAPAAPAAPSAVKLP